MDMGRDHPRGMNGPYPPVMDTVEGVYLTYPYCSFPSRATRKTWARPARASMLLAGEDETAPNAPCLEAVELLAASGVEIEVEILPGATHAFDEEDQVEGSPNIYNPEQAAYARERFRRFLRNTEG